MKKLWPVGLVAVACATLLVIAFSMDDPPDIDPALNQQQYLTLQDMGVDAPSVTAVRRVAVEQQGGRYEYVVACFVRSTGDPLPGVDVCIRFGDTRFSKATDGVGEARFTDIPGGRYLVDVSHSSYLPSRSTIHPSCEILVPGRGARIEWSKAFAYGVKEMPGIVDMRISSEDLNAFDERIFMGAELARMMRQMNDRYAPGSDEHVSIVCTKGDIYPDPVKLIAFNPERGPCEFEVAVTPVERFGGLTLLDLAGKPIVEPMAHITLQTVDSIGMKADIGEFNLEREGMKPKWGFIGTSVPSNGDVYVPAGTYVILTSGMSMRRLVERRFIEVGPGEERLVRYVLDQIMEAVEFQFLYGGERYNGGCVASIIETYNAKGEPICGDPENLRNGSVLTLPCGRNEIEFAYYLPASRELTAVRTVIEVERGVRVLTVELAP